MLTELYDSGNIDRLYVVYTDMKNAMESEAHAERLLPFSRAEFTGGSAEQKTVREFEFYPSVNAVLDGVMQSYVTGFLYSALVESFCCEQNARMTAMQSANQNAEKILDELSVRYNRVRQAAITQEITEVSAGAKAQKRNRLKQEMKQVDAT